MHRIVTLACIVLFCVSESAAESIRLGNLTPRGSRRVLYLSDPSNTTGQYSDPTTPEEMRQWVRALADGGVDTHLQCVFQQTWSNFYRSDHCEYDARPRHGRFIPMMDAGIIPLEVLIDESHRQEMEFFAGLRMNDRHGDNKEFFEKNKKWELAEFPGSVDYSFPEIRDWMFAIVEELAQGFDVDGIEFTFIRHGHVFPTAIARQQTSVLTEFMRRIRSMLLKEGEARGRHIQFGARVPQSLEGAAKLGYDVRNWILQELIDYVAPSDVIYTDFNARYEEFAVLTRATACKLYPTLQPLPCWNDQVNLLGLDHYRAAVQNFYGAGADGISLFNYQFHWAQKHWDPKRARSYPGSASNFPDALQYFHVLKDHRAVLGGNRHYVFYPLWLGAPDRIAHMTTPARAILKRSASDQRATYRFRVCENLPSSAELATRDGKGRRLLYNRAGKVPGAWMLFRAIGAGPKDRLAIDINGHEIAAGGVRRIWYEHGRPMWHGRPLGEYSEYRFRLTAPPAVYGDNALGLRFVQSGEESSEPVIVDEVEVMVNVPR